MAISAGLITLAGVVPSWVAVRLDKQNARLREERKRLKDKIMFLECELEGWRTLYPDEGWNDDKHKTLMWRRVPRQ